MGYYYDMNWKAEVGKICLTQITFWKIEACMDDLKGLVWVFPI